MVAVPSLLAAFDRSGTLGDDTSGSSDDFDTQVSSYVGDAMQTYDEAKTAYDAADQALKVLQAKSQAEWKTTQAAIETYVTALSSAVGVPYLGALFNAWFSQQPGAGAGPGVCATSPPPASDWPTLRAWGSYCGWDSLDCSAGYPTGQGAFEDWANPQLEYDLVLQNNCFSSKATPPAQLLAHLIAAWNGVHAGPTRVVTRTGINPNCPLVGSGSSRHFDCSKAPINVWDPIALALTDAFEAQYPPRPGTSDFGIAGNAPQNVTMTFTVNDGSQYGAKTVTLKLPPKATPAAPTSTTAGNVARVGAVAAAGTIAVWAAMGGRLADVTGWIRRFA